MPTPPSVVTAESLRTAENWIPAPVLATHPRLAQWAEDQSPNTIRQVIDGVSRKLFDRRYDSLTREANPKIARGRVWRAIETMLAEGQNPQDYALGSAVQTVQERVTTFAAMHSLPDPHRHMSPTSRATFAQVLNERRNSLLHGRIFGFEDGMSLHADDTGRGR